MFPRCLPAVVAAVVLVVIATTVHTAPVAAAATCTFPPLRIPSAAALEAQGLWGGVEAALHAIDELVRGAAADHPGTGFAMAVSFRGETIHQTGAGVARLLPNGSAVAPDADRSVWRLGSLTKLFTALLLARRVDAGHVAAGYDTPLTERMPGFAPTGAPASQLRGVTLGALAGQLAGVAREPPRPCVADQSDCNLTTAEILPHVNALPLLWAPGVRPAYSNLGFALLGRALESPDGGGPSFEAQVQADVLAPLNMTSSGFEWTAEALAQLARGGGAAGATHLVTRLGWAAPRGEMFATAADMARFLNFLTAVPAPAARAMGTPAARAAAPPLLSQWRKDEWLLKVGALMPDGVSGYGMPWELQLVAPEVAAAPAPSSLGHVGSTSVKGREGADLPLSTPAWAAAAHRGGDGGGGGAGDGGSRWLRTKSGDIDQFAGLLAVDPGTGAAVWMATNGAADGAPPTLPGAIVARLFPAVATALAAYDAWAPPPRAADMVGVYTAYVASVSANMTANISLVETAAAAGGDSSGRAGAAAGATTLSCMFSWGESVSPTVLVAPDHADDGSIRRSDGGGQGNAADVAVAVVHLPRGLPVSCLMATELAWDGETMVFDFAAGTLQVPGMLTTVFARAATGRAGSR